MTTESFSKYQEATESAIASSQVVDGFFVKRTQKIDDTIRYLARMTILLKSVYEVRSRPTRICRALAAADQASQTPCMSYRAVSSVPTTIFRF